MDAEVKKRIGSLVRLGITVAAVLWVLLKIDWRDQLRLADGRVIRGRATVSGDRFTFQTSEGTVEVLKSDDVGDDALQLGFLTLFRSVRPIYLIIGLVTYPLANVLGAIRWWALLRAHGIRPGFGRCLQLTWMGFFWSLVFPGVTGGDVVKAIAVAKSAEKRAESVLTVLLDRAIGLVGLAVLSGIVILFNLRDAELRVVSTTILVFLGAILGGGLLFYSRRLRRWLGLNWLLGLLPFPHRITQLDEALFEYRYHMRTMIGALVVSLAAHVVNVGVFYLAGAALGLPIAWQNYFVFIPIALMVAALPFSVGGIGVLEWQVAHFLSLGGVGGTASGAFALCVIYRMMTVIVSLPGAMIKLSENPAGLGQIRRQATAEGERREAETESPV